MIENGSARDRHDVDIGGAPYMVMVENLEKGISPFTMMEFIHDQVSIPCQVTVSPCKSWESYTRGIITVDSKKKLDKISEFLETPDHSIISSKGRYVNSISKPLCSLNSQQEPGCEFWVSDLLDFFVDS